jgi:hypothetical protein
MADEQKPLAVSEESNIAIPLRNLISLLGAVAAAVWGYSVLEGRINALESSLVMVEKDIEELQQANRDAATGVDPWATDVQQTTRIERAEADIKRMEELYLQSRKECAP